MRILIAGGGIGGLSAAVAMRRLGHDVIVIERAAELTEVGAAVACGPYAMHALNFLGAADHIRAINHPPEAQQYLSIATGEVNSTVVLGDSGKDRHGVHMYMTHRRDMIDALIGQAKGAEFRLNSAIARVEQDAQSVSVVLADGSAIEGDLLIGADGLRSTVRSSLFGQSEAVFSGFLAWRTVVPASNYARQMPNIVRLWTGPGRHAISYPIRKGEQVYSGFYVPAEEVQREDWQASGDVEELRASFAASCPNLQEILDGVDQAFITGIYYRPALDCWHQGRTVLVGDAAHPVLPTSGSGAALALEDAVALGGCLERHGLDHAAAFAEFQARRHARTSSVLIASRTQLQAFHETDPDRLKQTRKVNAGLARLDPTGMDRSAWLFMYNEVGQSSRPFADFQAEHSNPMTRPAAREAFYRWRNIFQPDDHLHGLVSQREGYERLFDQGMALPSGITVEAVDCDGVPALRLVAPGGEDGPAVVHLHGGGYAFGSARSSANLAARLAQAVGGWALVPDFRLVPEYGVDDMMEDVAKSYEWASKISDRIFLCGESSGAGLALNLVVQLRDKADREPLALWLLSPFIDPSLGAGSIVTNARSEPWLDKRMLLTLAAALTQGDDPGLPKYSPLNRNFKGLPPIHIFAADCEALADDARALWEKAQAASVPSTLTMVEDSVHCFAQFLDLPETADFIACVHRESAAHANAPATIRQ
jgi:salicylate hydroxylase